MIRTLLIDAGFILGSLVVALASFFAIKAVSGNAPHAEIAAVIATATPAATATTAPSVVASVEPTATPTVTPAATPTSTAAATTTAGVEPLNIDAALGRQGPNLCEAGVSTSEDGSKRRAVRSWDQITAIWNRVVESEVQLNAAIPSPFTLENAAASPTFLDEARRHEGVVQAAIDELVALRASGIHTRTRAMSLRQGDFYDLDRLTIQQTIQGVVNLDTDAWNGAAALDEQRTSYLDSARAEMKAVCAYLYEP